MNIRVTASHLHLGPMTRRLLGRMLCPSTGLCHEIGFVMRSPLEPRLSVAGGEMTGVHLLRGLPPPRPGAHHIGGCGTTYDEAVISTLGETIERYAQQSAVFGRRHEIVAAPCSRMVSEGRRVVPSNLQFFSPGQLSQTGFPFTSLSPDAAIGWVAMESLIDGSVCWVPAQLALLGYVRPIHEPRFMMAVSTGTAAYTRRDQALKRALLELIQIDSAMGHWYGQGAAVRLRHDARTRAVEAVVARHTHPDGPVPRFYWLRNADLPGFTVACTIENDEVPRIGVGLGCDLRLSRAMYKAFLEGVAVAQLAKVILFRQAVGEYPEKLGPAELYDLDMNVGYYAQLGAAALRYKFADGPLVSVSELPSDVDLGIDDDLRYLVDGFAKTKKQLLYLDLTTPDIRDLGFWVARVWSPNTLSLCLPSAPPVKHPRFQAYGGFSNEAPHPYP